MGRHHAARVSIAHVAAAEVMIEPFLPFVQRIGTGQIHLLSESLSQFSRKIALENACKVDLRLLFDFLVLLLLLLRLKALEDGHAQLVCISRRHCTRPGAWCLVHRFLLTEV